MRLKINHLTYDVLPLPPLWADAESAVGLHSPNEPAIYIRSDEAPAEQARILWHELIHALWHAFNIPKQARDEEQTCEVLESPLAALFVDNPHLSQALLAARDGKPIVQPAGKTIRNRKA